VDAEAPKRLPENAYRKLEPTGKPTGGAGLGTTQATPASGPRARIRLHLLSCGRLRNLKIQNLQGRHPDRHPGGWFVGGARSQSSLSENVIVSRSAPLQA
jgi:hypothetical protein